MLGQGTGSGMMALMMGRFVCVPRAIRGLVVVAFVAGCGGGAEEAGEVELEAACGATEDEGIDGTVDVEWVHEVDGEGRIVERDGDRDGDGDPEDVFTYEWNEDGRLLAEEGPVVSFDHRFRNESDWDGVNRIAFRQLYDSGAGFELVYWTSSTYADGPEVDEVWDWDGDGDLVTAGRLESQENGSDINGSVAVDVETFEYEEDRIVRSVVEYNSGHQYRTWTYRDDGALLEVNGFPMESVPPNTLPDYREAWTLDEDDLVVEHIQTNRGGGSVTRTVRDEKGRPIEIERDLGQPEPDVERMEYDGNRMTRYEVRTSSETTVYEYQFDCGP